MRLARGLVAVMLSAFAFAAFADTYPSRPVKIVVPFSAGGPADVYARFLAERLQGAMGQAFVIENRPGGGSVIGTDIVAKSAPDGYTLLLMSNTHTVNESLMPSKPFVLMRIVANLVSNAIKYTDKGRVLLGCRRHGDMLRIEVHDTGPGMTPEDFAQAGLRAVRLDRDRPTEGVPPC